MKAIVLTDSGLKKLQDLKGRTEDKDDGEVIRKALSIYGFLTCEIMKGGKVFIHKSDGSQMEARLF